MPDNRSQPRLSAEQINQVIEWIVMGYGATVISQKIEDEFDIIISKQAVWKDYIHNKKYTPQLKKLRADFEKEILKVPIAQKKVRLKILQDAIREAESFRLDKIHYDKDGNELSRIEKKMPGIIASLIKEARAEVEGDNNISVSVPVINLVYHGKTKKGNR